MELIHHNVQINDNILDRYLPETTVLSVMKMSWTEVSEPASTDTMEAFLIVSRQKNNSYRQIVYQGLWANDGVVAGEFVPQMTSRTFSTTDYFDFLDPFFQL